MASDRIGTASLTGSIRSRFVLLLASVGGIVALIWWAYATGHIKHVETVPPPVTGAHIVDRARCHNRDGAAARI